MILVTTVGRSGSSFLMKFLSQTGIDIGTDKWFDKFNAGLEHPDVTSINGDLISKIIKDKDVDIWDLWSRIAGLKLDVYKDPQFVAHKEIIRHWRQVRKDIKIIFLHRNPQDVVDSCKKIPEWTGPTYRLFPEMITAKNNNFLKVCDKLKIPTKKFKFPQMLDEGQEVIESLSEWIDFPDDALETWNKLRR